VLLVDLRLAKFHSIRRRSVIPELKAVFWNISIKNDIEKLK